MDRITRIATLVLGLSLTGCFGTPAARREMVITQQQGTPFIAGPIEIDTSAMRPDDCTVRQSTDRYGATTAVLVDGGVPFRVVIVPMKAPTP